MPKVYHFSEAGVFVNESEARPNPIPDASLENPAFPGDAFLLPNLATTIAPPTIPEGQQAVFENGAWTLEPIPAPPAEETPVETPEQVKAGILFQIAVLEYQQARPLRELTIANAASPVDTATATAAMARITALNTQIEALRATIPNTDS